MNILQDINKELDSLYICRNYGKRYTVIDYKDYTESGRAYAYYFILGKINDYVNREKKDSVFTNDIKYKNLYDLLKKYISQEFPSFAYTSVQIARNMKTIPHKDKGNIGDSIIVGVGDYQGGELAILIDDVWTDINIKYTPIMFDGSAYTHKTNDFTGTRYTLTFFTCK
jgi:hypothetical protein